MKNKSFTNLLLGIGVTNFGDSLFMIAIPIIIYAQTKNNLLLSISALTSVIPIILGFLLGPLFNKMVSKKSLIFLQIIQMCSVCLVFFVIFIGINHYNFVFIVIGEFIFSLSNYGSYILTQVIVPKVVEEKELAKANSLLTASRNIINGTADVISGILVTVISYFSIFIFDLITYFITILFFAGVEVSNDKGKNTDQVRLRESIKNYRTQIREGISEVFSNKFVVGILIIAVVLQFHTKISLITVVGYFADGGKSYLYGIYFAVLLIGFSLGSLSSAKIKDKIEFSKLTVGSYAFAGIAWLLLVFLFKEIGVLIATFIMTYISGIFEILVVTKFQEIYKDKLGNIFTIFMAIAAVAQIAGLLIAPFMIKLFGNANIILYLGMLNFIAIALYALNSYAVRKHKEKELDTI
ncbi:MFS transporter [Tepidibacillus sp. HK-1]|uniref:MFS transporter n=1 Tax=Tepidibacillus sp. HK-1 TaxID=1883407 RepID=UPI0008536AAC|nr:MFS transporter [Tepidibacillus sp. HK-1]GBF10976.1 enterobactin exporter EntS [Tepidibacillus sp. HK-1]